MNRAFSLNYASLGYSINVTGAKLTVNAPRADGLDSNGNINLISGSATIKSASTGGDAGLDYDGQLYISDDFDLNNQSGVSNMGDGMMGVCPVTWAACPTGLAACLVFADKAMTEHFRGKAAK